MLKTPYAWEAGIVENEGQSMNCRQTNTVFPAAVSVIIIAAIALVACAGNTSEELVLATKAGDIKTVKKLLGGGADVNAKDNKHHASLLMWAAHEGHTEVMNLLIQKGANIDTKKTTGETALWFAAQKGQLESLRILVHHDADVNVVGWKGATALEVARKNGHQEIVDYLRDAGAGG